MEIGTKVRLAPNMSERLFYRYKKGTVIRHVSPTDVLVQWDRFQLEGGSVVRGSVERIAIVNLIEDKENGG